MKILLLRHGPVCVPSDLCYGRLDVPLQEPSASWIGVARQYLTHILGANFNWWCSPSFRATRMAELLRFDDAPVLKVDSRLYEMDFGTFEGRRWSDIPQAESLPWTESQGCLPCPGGESFDQLRTRVISLLDEWQTLRSPLCAVCHGGPIRAFLQHALQIPFERLFALQVDFASFTLLEAHKQDLRVVHSNVLLPGYGGLS